MLHQGRLLVILIIGALSSAMGDTTVDVSQEWNAHLSSTTKPVAVSSQTPTLLPVSSTTTAIQCSCDPMTVQEKLEQATYAFTGTVDEISGVKKGKKKIVFDEDEIFKGAPKLDIEVQTEVTGTDCDIPYEVGQIFLVYARWEWGTLVTSRCMGTLKLEKHKSDTADLGPSEEMKDKLYLHLRDACMGLLGTPCCLSSLKSMRAGYYLPEPDGGCPSGSVPDRLQCAESYTWCIPVTDKDHRKP